MNVHRAANNALLTAVLGWTMLTAGQQTAMADEVLPAAGARGGVIVHLGCGDGRRTAELGRAENCCVHGLDTDPAKVAAARQHLLASGLNGRISVDTFDGARLPYIDNMVNLLVADSLGKVPQSEVLRVLAPGGRAIVGGEELAKPRPENIDEWTHYLHGPDNNAVANDTVVGPPRRLQWQGGPKWTRHHDRMSSFSAMVSTGGRIFYIIDEGSTASIFLPSRWALIARDAFNGKILWRRKIDSWYTRFKGLKDGPADAPRRLVADGGRVYATLNLDGPVSCLDAATGKTIRQYAGTERAEEILLSNGTLFVLAGPGSLGDGGRSLRPVEQRTILALDADSGDKRWQTSAVVGALTMAADDARLYYFDFDRCNAVCLDRNTGKALWTSRPLPSPEKQTSFFASKLVVSDGVVLFAGGEHSGMTKSGGGETRNDTLTALSAETGEILWTAKHSPSGYSSPENLFVIDGIVWYDASSNGNLDGTVTGRDLKSGGVKHRFPADETNYWFHHRCYPGRATSNYVLTSRTGIEFIDLKKEHWDLNHWVRGACLYGVMPSNGLLYTPPAPCICYAETMLHSFNAFAPAGPPTEPIAKAERLLRGPAYDFSPSSPEKPASGDWPTYRATNARSGATATPVAANLSSAWKTRLGGRLSSVTVAGGRLFVASVDRHTVYALDAASGAELWHYTAGGRVDSPPTVFEGRVLFGSADGRVYCLRADDGTLVWRFQAAPADRRIMVYEQLESLWPVHGSVLVHDGVAQFVTGRSIFVDGGMRLIRLDARSGKLISETVLDERNPQSGKNVQELVQWLNMPVGRSDVLSCDGRRVFMRSQAFDLEGNRLAMGPKTHGSKEGSLQESDDTHLFCPTGFLDDTWFHRTYWLYGSTWGSGWCGYYVAGRHAPAGKIISVGDDTVYVFGRRPQFYRWTTPMEYRLFAARKQWTPPPKQKAPPRNKKGAKQQLGGPVINPANYHWTTQVPILVRAMALAGPTLFVAGPRDVLDETPALIRTVFEKKRLLEAQEAAIKGSRGGLLWAVSAEDGSRLAEIELDAPPVFDGMAAAGGRLYLTTIDGHVECLAP